MSGQAQAVAGHAKAGEARPPMPVRPAAGLIRTIAVTTSALAAGAGLVGAGLAWPSRPGAPAASVQTVSRGGQIYAAECASCHGARLEGQAVESPAVPARHDVRLSWRVPPLGVSGHAWRHSDAELAAIVAHGTRGSASLTDGVPNMPAFAGQLDPGEIDAVLAYVKSRWPANVRNYQATLNPDGGKALAALMRDPAWTFPTQCLSPPAATRAP